LGVSVASYFEAEHFKKPFWGGIHSEAEKRGIAQKRKKPATKEPAYTCANCYEHKSGEKKKKHQRLNCRV